MHALSEHQKSELLANPNVKEITDKSIVYTSAFKTKAVELYLAGQNPNKIFSNANIPIDYFKRDYCRCCIKRWVIKYKSDGKESLAEDLRGVHSTGRPKNENLNDLSYDELLALVEIQKGVIEELKKKKALAKKKL